jgi:hypothetical protein
LNPTHHLEVEFRAFKFSSYQAMLSSKETKLQKEEVLLLFGGKENFIFSHNERNDYLSEKNALKKGNLWKEVCIIRQCFCFISICLLVGCLCL